MTGVSNGLFWTGLKCSSQRHSEEVLCVVRTSMGSPRGVPVPCISSAATSADAIPASAVASRMT